ncbi:MAG: hypothetical protein RI884_1031 [Pseudomonadota bacterium]|jgi:hypothetical protein
MKPSRQLAALLRKVRAELNRWVPVIRASGAKLD